MARFVRKGSVVYINNNTEVAIKYGDVVTLSKRIGIAASDIQPGTVGSASIEGIYEMQAESTDTLEIGDTVYLNASGHITKTAGDVVAGFAVEKKVAGSSIAIVKIG